MSNEEKVVLEETISKLIDGTDLKNACCSVEEWEKKITNIRGFVEADSFSAILSVVSNPIRLKILLIILERNWACNCEFEYILGIHQTLISHHLKNLRDAKLITYKREGKWKFYRITDDARPFLEELRDTLFKIPGLKD